MKNLISMVDYVLQYKTSDDYTFRKAILDYANFLNSKPTLGQFVPTDDEGNVLDEPNREDYVFEEHPELVGNPKEYENDKFEEDCNKYQNALAKVIFDGWVLYEVSNPSTIIMNVENYMHFYYDNDVYLNNAKINTISDLTKYNLKLK